MNWENQVQQIKNGMYTGQPTSPYNPVVVSMNKSDAKGDPAGTMGIKQGLLGGRGLGVEADTGAAYKANTNNPIGYKNGILSKKSDPVGGRG